MIELSPHIVVLDIETTGTDKQNDRIIQLSCIKVDSKMHKVVDTLSTYIQPEGSYTVGLGAYLKHGIKPDMLKDKPHLKDIAQDFLNFIKGCDLLTYNGLSFDLPFLMIEFKRCGIEFNPMSYRCIDAYKEELRRHPNNLEGTFERYCGKTMEQAGLKAHDALSDVKATYAVFRHQMQEGECKYEDMITEDDGIQMMDFNGNQEACFTFGKYRQVPIKIVCQVDPGYITWYLSKPDTVPSARSLLTQIFNNFKMKA
jgi:DNA polymerase-3 subunit epsilon